MSITRDFFKENFDKERVIIPWDLHPHITLKDAALVSLYHKKFRLHKKYYKYIDTEEHNTSCQEQDDLHVVKDFANIQNVCLLAAMLDRGCHDNIYSTLRIDEDEEYDLFEKEFLENAWNYAMKYEELVLGRFCSVLKKLGYKPKVDKDIFTSHYFGNPETKSARNV